MPADILTALSAMQTVCQVQRPNLELRLQDLTEAGGGPHPPQEAPKTGPRPKHEERMVAEFPWPSRSHPEERCRVVIRDYEGRAAVQIYPCYTGPDGQPRQGGGVMFRAGEVDQLRRALDWAAPFLDAPAAAEAPRSNLDLEGDELPSDAGPDAAGVRRDPAGVILNAAELTREQVRHERVLCPGCEEKVFERWPEGWDAHAAHRCRAVSGTEAERKAEYRRVFGYLMKPAPRMAEAPKKSAAPDPVAASRALGRGVFNGRPAEIFQIDYAAAGRVATYSVRYDGETARREVVSPPVHVGELHLG